ncbi:MAG: hypothetical protein ABI867_34980 [Kofleriaceae bacterium]
MSCTRCASPLEDGDLRCAICALPVVLVRDTDKSAERRTRSSAEGDAKSIEMPRAQILRCRECNAAVAFAADVQAPRCGFCGSTMTIEHPVDPVEVAELQIPFAVDREAAEASLRGWLGKRGWFAPATLRDDAVLESLVPLCWAGWIVNARATVAWTADSDDGARRSAWAPHAGQVAMTFASICVPASRGLRHDECRQLLPYYNLARATPIAGGDVMDGDVMIESFDAQRSAARQHVQRGIEATAKTRVEPYIPGRRFRNVRVSCLLEGQTTDRVALPVWILAYRYRGSVYRALVHGQRPEVVFGRSPIDWAKVARLVGGIALAVAAIAAVVMLVSGCGGSPTVPDAENFFERCEPSGPFASLSGRAAVQATLNVHVDAGGLIEIDTSSKMLLVMDLAQVGTDVAVTSTLCRVEIPDIPLAGQELPITFEVPDATIESVPTVDGTAVLASPSETCAALDSQPITLVLGARLDPAALDTAPLPAADDDAIFPACTPSAVTACTTATGIGCACDQESDGEPGATLVARNVPAIDLDRVFVTLRTTFSLHGKVHTADLVKGRIDATLETGVLQCRLIDGTPCSAQNVRLVKTLNPIVTPQAGNPSTFRAVRIPAGTTCAEVIATEGVLFPR